MGIKYPKSCNNKYIVDKIKTPKKKLNNNLNPSKFTVDIPYMNEKTKISIYQIERKNTYCGLQSCLCCNYTELYKMP